MYAMRVDFHATLPATSQSSKEDRWAQRGSSTIAGELRGIGHANSLERLVASARLLGRLSLSVTAVCRVLIARVIENTSSNLENINRNNDVGFPGTYKYPSVSTSCMGRDRFVRSSYPIDHQLVII